MGSLSPIWLVVSILFFALLAPREADAQCGANRSSCSACHNGTRASLPRGDAWHEDHAFGDLCSTCHGGHADANDVDEAHAGLVDPVASPATCGSCHAAEATSLLGRYRASGGAGVGPAVGMRSGISAQAAPPRIARRPSERWPNVALTAIVAAVAAVGALFGSRRERGREGPRVRREPALLDCPWSPYVAGIGLGLVVAVSMAIFGHRLSGAGAYQNLSGFVGRPIAPESIYWRHIVPTGLTWDVLVLIGSVVGAFVAARLSGDFALRTTPDRQWADVFGPSVARRWLLAFVGSLLTAVGGGLAGGCTASLAVSGGGALAPAAFAFMAGMFASGIPTALFIYRRNDS
jgi:uncharacterized membrane protein YedE/YeeE